MLARGFFARHPVFTDAEFVAFHGGTRAQAANLLEYHARVGHVVGLRRRLYAVVPEGVRARAVRPDPWLVACRLAPEAVVSFASALDFHEGREAPGRLTYVAPGRSRPVALRGHRYVQVQLPKPLRDSGAGLEGVEERAHAGGTVRVTGPERTVVDLLAEPRLGGGWRRLWTRLARGRPLRPELVARLALARDSATLAARAGLWLQQNRERQPVPRAVLDELRAAAPRQPTYLDRTKGGRLARGWNLIVPEWMREPVRSPEAEAMTLSEDQRRLLAELGDEPLHLDELAERAGLGASTALAEVLALELAGLCRPLPGTYYVRRSPPE